MATGIDRQCTLVSCFAEFDLLPDLLALPQDIELPGGGSSGGGFAGRQSYGDINAMATTNRWRELLEQTDVNTDHVEPGDLTTWDTRYFLLAVDAWNLAIRLRWIGRYELTEPGARLARIAERPWDDRTEEDDRTMEDTLAESVRAHYIGRNDFSVVDLIQSAADLLSRTKDPWASHCPGLLLVEFETLIYWAFRRPKYAIEVRERLVTRRREAMHRFGGPSDDGDPWDNTVRLADATAQLYFETEELAAKTDLTVTAVRSTSMLLTYAGLMDEFSLGPVNYLLPPERNPDG